MTTSKRAKLSHEDILQRILEMQEQGLIKHREPEILTCGAKTRARTPCKKSPMIGKSRCRNHGALSKSGKDHWNYQHGKATKAQRLFNKQISAELKQLKSIAETLGMFD